MAAISMTMSETIIMRRVRSFMVALLHLPTKSNALCSCFSP
jgi:hypothetical protein